MYYDRDHEGLEFALYCNSTQYIWSVTIVQLADGTEESFAMGSFRIVKRVNGMFPIVILLLSSVKPLIMFVKKPSNCG